MSTEIQQTLRLLVLGLVGLGQLPLRDLRNGGGITGYVIDGSVDSKRDSPHRLTTFGLIKSARREARVAIC